jgi:hypothetical protein
MAFENQNPDLNEDAFNNLLNEFNAPEGGGEQSQLPQNIGTLPMNKFEELLVEATGGKLNNYSEFQEALTAKEKYQELQQKLGHAETQLNEYKGGPKYSNELVQKLDEMYRNGVPEDNIQEFIRLQRMDVEKLSDKEVMKMVYSKDYPGIKDEELDQLLEDEYGDLDGIGGIKMKKAAIDGRKKLSDMKVNIAEPEHIRMQKTEEAQAVKRFQNWEKVVNSVFNKESHEFKLDVGGKESVLNFTLPESSRQKLNIEVTRYATMNNIPPTKEGLAQLQDFAERTLLFAYGKEIMGTLMRNASANTRQEELARVHNIEITRSGENRTTNVNVKKSPLEEQRERLNKEAMNGQWR